MLYAVIVTTDTPSTPPTHQYYSHSTSPTFYVDSQTCGIDDSAPNAQSEVRKRVRTWLRDMLSSAGARVTSIHVTAVATGTYPVHTQRT